MLWGTILIIFSTYLPIILDLKGFQIVVHLRQPYSVHAKRITMTQEAIQRQIEALDKVAATLNTPEKARQFLIDAGIIKAPKKKTKAKRQTK